MPINPSQTKALATRLRDELAAASQELDTIDEQIRLVGDDRAGPEPTSNHPGDAADVVSDRQRLMTIREDLANRRSEIEHALDKLEAGRYGDCERCGKGIAFERLEALPFARHCIECQEIVEQAGVDHR